MSINVNANDKHFFFSFFYICLNSFKIVNNLFILHFFSLNFYNIIGFIFSQMQVLTFCFEFLKTNLTVALKVRFIFFLILTCNFIAAKNKEKNDDENVLNDCFDWKVSLIIRKRSSTTVFRDNNIFFSRKTISIFHVKLFLFTFR